MARLLDLAISLESMWGYNRPIPEPSPAGEGMFLIAPDARTQAALLIRRARGNGSLAELARALQTSWPLARLGNPRHSPTRRLLERAAAALYQCQVLALE